jgi:succinate-semialdehyde dehydrogenase/glutarate-semialdehyde dehydrogenase
VNSQTIQVRNPATLENVAELAIASPAEVAAAVERGRHAQRVWQQSRFSERAHLLYRLRDLLLDEGDKLADILTAETGRPRAEVYGNELFYLCNAIGTWAKKSRSVSTTDPDQAAFPLGQSQKVNLQSTHRVASSASSARGIFPWS